MKSIPLVLLATLILSGCKTMTVSPVSITAQKLSARDAVYVVTPQNGSYNKQQYENSGATVAKAFDAALSRHNGNGVVGPSVESLADAVAAAKSKNCTFVLLPKITRWEDRATEWSGIRDKMELLVRVVRVEDSSEVKTAAIVGKSRWMTFGGDHPEDLVQEPVQEFIDSLFASTTP